MAYLSASSFMRVTYGCRCQTGLRKRGCEMTQKYKFEVKVDGAFYAMGSVNSIESVRSIVGPYIGQGLEDMTKSLTVTIKEK